MSRWRGLWVVIVVLWLLAACAPAAPQTGSAAPAAGESGDVVELEFWYIPFTLEEEGHAAQIAEFEAANPDIKIKVVQVPYEEITQKVAASVPVGKGPDIIIPYYGWVPLWRQNGFLAPLPDGAFPPAEMKEKFVSGQDAMLFDGQYYGFPVAMNAWALFYNKDAFAEAGIESPPTTWEEFRETAIKLTKRDDEGKLVRAGYYVDYDQQEHIVWKVLVEQFGQPMFDAENRHALWNESEIGYEAFEWFVNLILVDKVTEWGWAESASTAFDTGLSAMNFGSTSWPTRLATNSPDLDYGIAPYLCGPAEDPALACRNLGQYWAYSLTTKAANDPVKLEAAVKFLQYLASPEGYTAYLDVHGGLPALKSQLEDPKYAEDPLLSPFIATMNNARAIPWVDELGERDISMQMLERVVLNGENPREVLDWGTEATNRLRDEFFAKEE